MHVYKITDLTNDFIYVGQHCKENLEAYLQWNIKAAEGNRGNKKRLYRAMRAHGGKNFKIESLARLVDGLPVEDARELLDKIEILFIRCLRSNDPNIGYNLTAGGGGQLGRRWKHTEEWKKQQGDRCRGRKCTWGDKISAAQKGIVFSPERRAKLAASQRGVPKAPRTEEHRRNLGVAHKSWWANISPERKAEVVAKIKAGQQRAREAKLNGLAS